MHSDPNPTPNQVVRVSKSFEQLVGVASRRYIVGRRLQELS